MTPDAGKFTVRTVLDHIKLNAKPVALTAKKHVTLPIALSNKHKDVLKNVMEKRGVRMTQAYPKEMHLDTATRMKPTLDAAS